jgi:hypothetical protein
VAGKRVWAVHGHGYDHQTLRAIICSGADDPAGDRTAQAGATVLGLGDGGGGWICCAPIGGDGVPGPPDALGAFVATCRGIVPYYASLGRPSLFALVVGSFPSVLLAITLPALLVYAVRRPWKTWEGSVLATCAVLGSVHSILQAKGFPYHRYPSEAFLLLICGLVLIPALWRGASEQMPWVRWVALLGVVLGAFYLAPASASIACHFDWRNQEFNQMLAADLKSLGAGEAKQVQCIDMTAGCLNTLYNLQIVQATGYLYDCYMF